MINEVQNIIYNQVNNGKYYSSGIPFSKYQKVYLSTNENINEYLNNVDFNKKTNALSVMASGDHIFNIINKGILNIDTFDTNAITEYYVLGLKKAMILKYNYKEYLKTYSKFCDKFISLDELTFILKELLIYMDDKYKIFWNSIIEYNYKIQKNNKNKINLFYMLFINISSVDYITKNNNYLLNENEYNKLKDNINKTNILFKNINAKDLYKEFNNKYDFILLSNILDYFNKYYNYKFDYDCLREYIDNLFNILKENGTIFLNYIIKYSTNNFKRNYIINNSNIKITDLSQEKVISVNSFDRTNCQDGVLLVKKH